MLVMADNQVAECSNSKETSNSDGESCKILIKRKKKKPPLRQRHDSIEEEDAEVTV